MNRDYYHLRDVWIYRTHDLNRFGYPGGRVLVLLPPVQTVSLSNGVGLSVGRVTRSAIATTAIIDEAGVRVGLTKLSPGQCAAQARRIFNHTQLPQPVADAVEALAAEHIGRMHHVRWVRTDINKWLSSRVKGATRGAPLGLPLAVPDAGLPFHVEVLHIDKHGYLTDGTYYGLRARGQKLYAAYQDGATRRIIDVHDAATSAEVIDYIRAKHGLNHFRDI